MRAGAAQERAQRVQGVRVRVRVRDHGGVPRHHRRGAGDAQRLRARPDRDVRRGRLLRKGAGRVARRRGRDGGRGRAEGAGDDRERQGGRPRAAPDRGACARSPRVPARGLRTPAPGRRAFTPRPRISARRLGAFTSGSCIPAHIPERIPARRLRARAPDPRLRTPYATTPKPHRATPLLAARP
ncbi:hypothetical protein GCM10010389_14740 [Streptomyces echinoruber]|uniref:Uncharacterized protein n=1 Tax=Streptomyces echinoruber TaxID=68898 RepID=A0A918QYH1_9ACTN|nr:hypothetical protein GCM10010389_14740 [Streptomyces echinoruber]